MSKVFFSDSLGQQLKTLNNLVEKEMNNGLKKQGLNLTGTQVAVLVQIDGHEELLTQKQLEIILKLSHPTTRGIIKRLVEANLIESFHDINDRRQILLKLTKKGREFLSKQMPIIQEHVDSVESVLTKDIDQEEQEQISKLIKKMIHNMEK